MIAEIKITKDECASSMNSDVPVLMMEMEPDYKALVVSELDGKRSMRAFVGPRFSAPLKLRGAVEVADIEADLPPWALFTRVRVTDGPSRGATGYFWAAPLTVVDAYLETLKFIGTGP